MHHFGVLQHLRVINHLGVLHYLCVYAPSWCFATSARFAAPGRLHSMREQGRGKQKEAKKYRPPKRLVPADRFPRPASYSQRGTPTAALNASAGEQLMKGTEILTEDMD